MNGLALARDYYHAWRDVLLAPYAGYRERIAAGLVGFGSECFGFDDEISRDHDFGPGFCLWLTDEDYAAIGQALQADYSRLPAAFAGFPARESGARSGQRVGVFSISGFYAGLLGAAALPASEADWLQIPEDMLACAVNGEVFEDPCGQFSAIRSTLAGYYPSGARRLKLATAVACMAQSGQYNLPRAIRRKDGVAAFLALAEFIRHSCGFLHVMSGRYAPFYKWLHRSTRGLPCVGDMPERIAALSCLRPEDAPSRVEDICAGALDILVRTGYAQPGDSFLEAHVDTILAGGESGNDHA